jgi:hypothetical protein
MRSTPVTPTSPRLDLADLIYLVRAVASDERLWRPRVRFGTSSRWWTQLLADDAVDIWLLTWLADQSTELHDHGGSAAAFHRRGRRVGGNTRRSHRRAVPCHPHRRADLLGLARCRAGVRNGAAEPAVSIHAYSPPLTRMTYYRRARRGLTVARTVLTDEPEAVTAS